MRRANWHWPLSLGLLWGSMVRRESIAVLAASDKGSSSSPGHGISTICRKSSKHLNSFYYQKWKLFQLLIPCILNQKWTEGLTLNNIESCGLFNHKSLNRYKNPPLLRIFWNTRSGVWSLNGGTPVRNSKRQTPRAHQSTPSSVKTMTSILKWVQS